MPSGCPQRNHGGVSPACHLRDRSNNGTFTSAHVPAHETQHMFASQSPWDHRVDYHLSHRQDCFAQAPQNVPALHHREDVQASSLAAGFQHAVPTGDKLSVPNNCQRMSREDNRGFSSSEIVPAQCRRHFVATANERAFGQSVVQSSRKFSNGCVSISSGECSNTNNNRLAQTQINPALSENCSCTGLKGMSHNSTSGIHPQHDSTNISCTWPTHGPEQSLPESRSLLRSLLEKPSTQTPSRIPANSPLASLGQDSFSNSHKQLRSSLSRSSQPILSDDQILDFIKIRLAYYKSQIKRSNGGPDLKEQNFCFSERHSMLGPQNQSDCRSITPKGDSVAHPPTIFDHLEKIQGYSDTGETERLSFKQFSTYGDEAYQEDKSKKSRANAESPLKPKTKNDCARSTPEKDSTGTPVSAVENSNDAYKNKSVEKSASLDFELPVKKQLDITVSADSDDKLIYSFDSSQDKTIISDDERFNAKWHNKALKNDLSTLPALHYSLNALRELVTSLESVNTIAEKDNISDTILQQYWNGTIDNVHVFTSTEYRQIMVSVAATCTKTEDENPVVLTAVSGMTLAELAEKQPTSRSQEEYKSVWLNVNKSLDDIDKDPGVSSSLKRIPDKEEGSRSLKPVEALEFNNVQAVTTDLSKGLKAKSGSVLSENKTTEYASMTGKRGLDHEKIISPASVVSLSKNVSERRFNQTKQDTQHKDVMKDADSVYSQVVLSTALSENKCEQVPLSRGSANLKYPQYDDISDVDSPPIKNMNVHSELNRHLSDNKDKGSGFSVCCKVPQYEDITDDESSQIQDVTVVPQAVMPLCEFNTDKSPLGNQDVISVGELIPKEQVIQRTEMYESAQVCCCPYYVETDDGFEKQLCPKCETERQLGQETNFHSCSTQSKVHGGSLVLIPVSPSTCAPLSNGSLSSDEEGRGEAPTASPTVAGQKYISVTKMKTSQYEVMIKNDGVQYQKVTEPNNLQKLKEPHHEEVTVEASPQNEDLTDLTAFQCESKREDESEDHWMVIPVTISDLKFEPAHVNQDRLENMPQHSETGEKTVQGGRILTSSELHQSASKPAPASTTINTTTTTLEVFETLDSFLNAKRNSFNYPMSAESEKDHAQSKDQEAVIKTGKSTPSLELVPKSELDRSRRQSSSCETEDSSDYSVGSPEHNYMTVSRKCWDKRPSPKTHVRALSFKDTYAPESESKNADGKFTDVKKQIIKIISTDSSDDSDCVRKNTHLIKSRRGSDLIRRKTKRRKSSKKTCTLDSDSETESNKNSRRKAKKKRLLSGSEDSLDDVFRPQNRRSPETVDNQWPTAVTEQKPQQTGLSEELTLMQQQSVGRVESLSIPAPVIPRLVVQMPSDPTDRHLKLSKQSTVHKQGKDETPTKNNQKNNSSKKKHKSELQRHKEKYSSNKKAVSSKPRREAKTSEIGAQSTAKNCKSSSSSSKNHSSQDGPSTSRESLASAGGLFPRARHSSAFSRERLSSRDGSSSSRECLSESKHSRSISKVQRSYTSERPSTSVSHSSPTKYPSESVTVVPSAKQQVRNEWQSSFFPTRRDKKISQETEEDPRRSLTHSKSSPGKQDYDAGREARLGPSHSDRLPRQRHNSYESVTPLMKKSISQAKMLTQARHQETPYQQRPSVSKGYKWAEKTPSARKTMGSRAKWRKNRSFSMPQQ